MKKVLNILKKLSEEDANYLKDILFKDEIELIREKANYLRKMPYGAGGQCMGLQTRNQLKGQLGKDILAAIKTYEENLKQYFGDLDD